MDIALLLAALAVIVFMCHRIEQVAVKIVLGLVIIAATVIIWLGFLAALVPTEWQFLNRVEFINKQVNSLDMEAIKTKIIEDFTELVKIDKNGQRSADPSKANDNPNLEAISPGAQEAFDGMREKINQRRAREKELLDGF